MNGHAVARVIRAEVPVVVKLIALTGYGPPRTCGRRTEAGFDAHLVKPVYMTRLAGLLRMM